MRIETARRLLAVVRGVDWDEVARRDGKGCHRVRMVEERLHEHLWRCGKDADGMLALYRAPAYLSDQGAAVAMLERSLPGWNWSVSRRSPCEASDFLSFYADCGTQAWVDGGERPEFARAGGHTPAQAIVTANLRAWMIMSGHDAT